MLTAAGLLAFSFLTFGTAQVPAKPDVLSAQEWAKPPKEILDAVLAPWHTNVGVGNYSPDNRRFIVSQGGGMTPMAALAKPYHNLGGLQVDFKANRARSFTTRNTVALRVVTLADGKEVPIVIPQGLKVSDAQWSPDGTQIAFLVHGDAATHLYVADPNTGKSRQVAKRPLMLTFATGIRWSADSKAIVTVVIPDKRGNEPARPDVPQNPLVRVTDDKANRIRTYASLLDGPYEEALLEYHTTGQLAVVEVGGGKVREIGKPAMIESVDASPDAKWFRVTVMERPFSFIVPMGSFGRREVLWDDKGEVKVELSARPLSVAVSAPPKKDKEPEKRAMAWRPDGAGLCYLQNAPEKKAEEPKKDGDTPKSEQRRRRPEAPPAGAPQPPRKDRVMLWTPPFGKEDAKVVHEADSGIESVAYSADCKTLFVSQTVAGKRRLTVVKPDDPNAKPVVIAEFAPDDIYADPGNLVTKPGPRAGSVVRMSADGKAVYLSGTTYSKKPLEEAPKPFVDRVDLTDGKKTRIFESKADLYEVPTMLDDEGALWVVQRQSPTVYPNYSFVDKPASKDRQITQSKDYAPDVTQCRRETITVTRADGFKFRVRVLTPRYAANGRALPGFFWFYPGEVTDQAAYDKGKRTENKNTYPRVGAGSVELLLRMGYVVIFPDCPIVGPAGRQNDGYVPQLRNNLSAIIDELDRREMVDRRRLAIGGHSYGAFGTANAMVHTPFFKAGVAGDGNYMRSLTPFGFQAEGRQIWESRELYQTMSPLLYAEQMTGALMMYHGGDDQNMGTNPENAIKMFQALEALGKPAALYMYPYEDHGQIAFETRLDLWARWVAWLDKYVKNAK